MSTAIKQLKYINNRVYQIILIDGKGGRTVIMPGEVVGEQGKKLVDHRKGLVPYDGPREIGQLEKMGSVNHAKVNMNSVKKIMASVNQEPVRKNETPEGIVLPRVDGAMATDKVALNTTQAMFLEKNLDGWREEAKNGKLKEYSRGNLVGLSNWIGIDVPQNITKQEMLDQLNGLLLAKK